MSNETYFPFSVELQNQILYLFLTDLSFIKTCKNRIKPEYFTSEIQQVLVEIIFGFFEEFNDVPKEHILDIIKDVVKEKGIETYTNYINNLLNLNPVKFFVIKELDKFIQHRNWEISLVKCVDYLKENDFESIEKIVVSNLRDKIIYADVKNVLEEDLSSFYNSREDEKVIPTGIKALDKLIRGLKKKELSVFVAPLSVGKTWCMIHLGSKALVYGKDVLHITLEMSRHEIKSRYLMHFAGVVNKEKNEIEVWEGNEKSLIVPDLITNIKKVKKSISIMKKYGGKLFILGYPNDVFTINTLESILNFIEIEQDKPLDMVIIDGADGMRYDKNFRQEWEKGTKIYENLRRIGVERDLAMVTVSHSGRDSLGKKLITSKDTKGTIDKLNIADLGISINQTVEEYLNQQARLFVMRNRSEVKWKQILINQNYNLGHFCVYSELIEE